ncbi:MAG: DUF4157 domain-containing protein [Desulfobacterales bacterium]|nr:DUF4157 domain-containing protein [Desulfobacterales bacterium]
MAGGSTARMTKPEQEADHATPPPAHCPRLRPVQGLPVPPLCLPATSAPGGGRCAVRPGQPEPVGGPGRAGRAAGPAISVSQPSDAHEVQAERTAQALFPSSAAAAGARRAAVPGLPRRPQAAPAPPGPWAASGRSAGQPLPEPARAEMEAAFGADFSQVRIHTDERAARPSQSLRGRGLHLRQRHLLRPVPLRPRGRRQGRRLVAHELTHTLQQRTVLGQISREATGRRTALQCVNDNSGQHGGGRLADHHRRRGLCRWSARSPATPPGGGRGHGGVRCSALHRRPHRAVDRHGPAASCASASATRTCASDCRGRWPRARRPGRPRTRRRWPDAA